MSSAADAHYSTLEEFLESQRSPTLCRAEPNFGSFDTPPPLVDAPDDSESIVSDSDPISGPFSSQKSVKCRAQSSVIDTILIRQLAPGYPDIAAQAGTQPCCDECEAALEHRRPDPAYAHHSMIAGNLEDDVYPTSAHQALVQQALTASRRASEKLNDAMRFQQPNLTARASSVDYHDGVTGPSQFLLHHNRDRKRVSISITSLTNEEVSDSLEVAHLSLQGSPTNQRLDILPSLHI